MSALIVKLGDICNIQSGGTPSRGKSEFWEGGCIPWVKISDMHGKFLSQTEEYITDAGLAASSAKMFSRGTILYTIFATLGETCILNIDATTNQAIAGISVKHEFAAEIAVEYLYYFLMSIKEHVMRVGRGVAQNNINLRILRNVNIVLPSLERQNEIVRRLSDVESMLSLRQRQAEKLDELVKARFVEMFGDPVRNCLHTAARPMTEICQIIDGDRGKNYPKADDFFDKGDCLFLNAKNVTKAGFNFDECMFITKDKDNVLRKGKLQRGDIILTTRGTIGNLAFYTDDVPYSDIRINSGMVILRMNREYINPIYFIEQFKMQLENIKRKIASGTAQPQLPISTMNKIKVIIPDIRLQANFANFVHEVDREKERIQRSAALLETLKRSLMQQYFG